jgi:hypothetical protein
MKRKAFVVLLVSLTESLLNPLEAIMAKKGFVVGMFAVMLVCGFSLSGCTTARSLGRMNPMGGNYQDIKVPNKDFVSMGLIFAEYYSKGDGAGSEDGEVYTYYKLLQEAQKLGADAIVNVVIEGAQEASTEKIFGKKMKEGVTKKTWFGSATAIKYTDTINVTDEKSVIVVGSDGKQIISEKANGKNTPLAGETSSSSTGETGSSGTSKKKWWNPLTWFKK